MRGRAEVNKWLLFTVTELEQPLWRIAKHRQLYPEAQRLAADIPLAGEDFRRMAERAASRLERLPAAQTGAGFLSENCPFQ